jgi:hypothetical protein
MIAVRMMVSVTEHLSDEFRGELVRRRRRHAMEIMLVCVGGLVPWTIYLALTLPGDYRAHYWRLSWAGFDVILLVAMALTAYLGWRGRLTVIVGAVATATLLICDAWFDVVLDLGTRDVWTSLGSAIFLELPLAAFFLWRAYLIMRLTLARTYGGVPAQVRGPGREDGRELSRGEPRERVCR